MSKVNFNSIEKLHHNMSRALPAAQDKSAEICTNDYVTISADARKSAEKSDKPLGQIKDGIKGCFKLIDKLKLEDKHKQKGRDRLGRFLENVDIIEKKDPGFAKKIASHKLGMLKDFEKHYKESSNLKGYFKEAYTGSYNIGTLDGGKVLRNSQPSQKDLKWFIREGGVKTVINLRTEEEYWQGYQKKDEEKICKDNGVKYKCFKLEDSDDTPPSKEQLKEIVDYIGSHEQPAMFHCALGKGRTGMVAGAYRILKQGWSADQAIKEAVHYGFDPKKNPKQAAILKDLAKNR